MKISYVGNRKNLASDGKSFNTESHICRTLEKLGHEVNFIQEDEIQGEAQLVQSVIGSDLFLWTRTWKGKVSELALVAIHNNGIPTASFHLDKYTGIARDGGLDSDTFWKTEYVFSPEVSDEAKKIFKQYGINQFYLPPGVFEDECYLAKPDIKYMHDIVFVGGGKQYAHPEWPYRAKLIQWLEDTYGSRFKHYGWPDETIRGEELNKLYASCKIVIGDSLCKDFKDEYYFSDRVFETTGRGGFIIHPYVRGLENHFELGSPPILPTELVTYKFNDFPMLKENIDYFLVNDELREKIRIAGHRRTKRDNTYTNRMTTMLDILKKEGAI
jgi:hypothetical protein